MKKKIIGVFAHVDSGKTTFCEQVLYHTAAIGKAGRVDQKTAFMDASVVERSRGITVFMDQAILSYKNQEIYLLDTPGHVDFSSEMERTLDVIEYAILIISGVEGIESHTKTLWSLLEKRRIPTFIFINKMDREGSDKNKVMDEISKQFSIDPIDLTDYRLMDEQVLERLVENDDTAFDAYFKGVRDDGYWREVLCEQHREMKVIPVYHGSALNDVGVIESFDSMIELDTYDIRGEIPPEGDFSAFAYKAKHDKSGLRWVYLKCLRGTLKVKDAFEIKGHMNKVNQMKKIHGRDMISVNVGYAGDLIAVAGLDHLKVGEGIGYQAQNLKELEPSLQVKLIYGDAVSDKKMLSYARILEDEDPALAVKWNQDSKEIVLKIMGLIQLEVLQYVIEERFGVKVSFSKPDIIYKETISNTVFAYGHFEPLRHYAEVHLKLEPNLRNAGITFENQSHPDNMTRGNANLVKTHIFEKEHRGILGGYGLTDVHIILLTGRAHEKHTSGGDFREATIRALRQGLEQANNLLLEPIYEYTLSGPREFLGRFMTDVQKASGIFEDPIIEGDFVILKGKVPVSNFVEYSTTLAAYTSGRALITLKAGGYAICHNSEEVLDMRGYEKERDLEYPSGSVFCKKGSSYTVTWDESKMSMHCPISIE